MTDDELTATQRAPRRGESSKKLPGEIAFSIIVPLSYSVSFLVPLIGIPIEVSMWWVAGTMLLGGVGSALRVGFFLSGISTALVGIFVIVPMTVAAPEILLPWITSTAGLGVGLTGFGMWRTGRLRADWPRVA